MTTRDEFHYRRLWTKAEDECEALRKALRACVGLHDRETCVHETCERGGVLWTICCDCGRKWADDEGGFTPHEDPPEISEARALLARIGGEG